jgi:hypothetical protein
LGDSWDGFMKEKGQKSLDTVSLRIKEEKIVGAEC